MLQTLPIINQIHDFITLLGMFLIIIFNLFVWIPNIKKKKKIKELIIILLSLIVGLILYCITYNFTVLKYIILLISTLSFNFETLIKNDFRIKLFLTCSNVLLDFCDLTQTKLFVRPDGTIRYTLGFVHPNTFGFYAMILVLEFFYLNREKKSIKPYLFSILMFILNWKISDSRTSAIIILFVIFYNLIRRNNKLNSILYNRIIKRIVTYSFFILTVISIFLGISYNMHNSVTEKMNEILSYRPQNYELYLSNYPIKVTGNELPNSVKGKFLDNSYLLLLINLGLLQYLVYAYLITETFRKLYRQKDKDYLIVVLLLLLIYGMMETMVIKATMNTFLLATVLPLQEKMRSENEE